MALASLVRSTVFGFFLLWIFFVVIGRAYALHAALQDEWIRRRNNTWLLQKCDDPMFYIHMKEHTDLCAVVVRDARSNVWLNALHTVASGTHMCGALACTDVLRAWVFRIGWQAGLLLLLSLLLFPRIVYVAYLLVGGPGPARRASPWAHGHRAEHMGWLGRPGVEDYSPGTGVGLGWGPIPSEKVKEV